MRLNKTKQEKKQSQQQQKLKTHLNITSRFLSFKKESHLLPTYSTTIIRITLLQFISHESA